jgi:hypothetical protein
LKDFECGFRFRTSAFWHAPNWHTVMRYCLCPLTGKQEKENDDGTGQQVVKCSEKTEHLSSATARRSARNSGGCFFWD